MSKWTIVVMSGDILSKKILDINSCLDYLENNITQDVEIISIQEEEEENVNGIVDNIDSDRNGSDASGNKSGTALDDTCNTEGIRGEAEYVIILSDEEDLSNSNLTDPTESSTRQQTITNKDHKNDVLELDLNPSESFGKYQCYSCPLSFGEKNCLSRHLVKHFNYRRPFMCPVCEKTYPYKRHLETHIYSFADIRAYQCEQCDKAFSAYHMLWRHKKNTHSGMGPLKCPKCDYQTFEQSCMNDHLVVHSDERPFKCNYCSYASKRQNYLTCHKKIHKNDKRYKCDVCSSRFVLQQALRDHRKTHFWKGLISHQCRICLYTFNSPHALRKHVELAHRGF